MKQLTAGRLDEEVIRGTDNNNILEVRDLKTYFYSGGKEIHSVDGVSFNLRRGTTLGIVGESGSGKSITSMSIMGLLAGTSGRVVSGSILFEGTDLLKLKEKERRKYRGSAISMIFQEPMTSLNPVLTIGYQMIEAVRLHQNVSKKTAFDMSVEMLERTGVPRASHVMREFPLQLSGGQRQRVMIAMALICKPKILIADEPTTALDVTIQAQILELINKLKQENGTSVIFITHDLGVVAETCDDVAVMYCGEIVERGTVQEIFHHPSHPYTYGLLHAIPRFELSVDQLQPIPGNVPSPGEFIKGCRFAPRCRFAIEKCREAAPELSREEETHPSRCWLREEERRVLLHV